jgi:hypothetical protein
MRKTVGACCAIAGSVALLVLPACWVGGASTAGAVEVSPRAAPADSVTIAAVGDTMLGTTPDLPPNPGSYLGFVGPVLDRGAEVVFGNLEGTLTTATASKCGAGSANCFAFRDPPGYAPGRDRKGGGKHETRSALCEHGD